MSSAEIKCKKYYEFKMHFCIFCKKEFTRLAEHFVRKHRDEQVVKEILLTTDKQQKLQKFRTLRLEGDYIFNMSEQDGDRKIVKAPHQASNKKKYFDCPVCLARIGYTSRRNHKKLCQRVSTRNVLSGSEDIFKGLPEVIINKIRKSMYMSYFLKQMFKAGVDCDVIRTMCRNLIELEDKIQKLTGEIKPLSSFLTVVHVDDVIKTIEHICGYENVNGEKLIRLPFRAERLCKIIDIFCYFLIIYLSKRDGKQKIFPVIQFLKEFESGKLIRNQTRRAKEVEKLKRSMKPP